MTTLCRASTRGVAWTSFGGASWNGDSGSTNEAQHIMCVMLHRKWVDSQENLPNQCPEDLYRWVTQMEESLWSASVLHGFDLARAPLLRLREQGRSLVTKRAGPRDRGENGRSLRAADGDR